MPKILGCIETFDRKFFISVTNSNFRDNFDKQCNLLQIVSMNVLESKIQKSKMLKVANN